MSVFFLQQNFLLTNLIFFVDIMTWLPSQIWAVRVDVGFLTRVAPFIAAPPLRLHVDGSHFRSAGAEESSERRSHPFPSPLDKKCAHFIPETLSLFYNACNLSGEIFFPCLSRDQAIIMPENFEPLLRFGRERLLLLLLLDAGRKVSTVAGSVREEVSPSKVI